MEANRWRKIEELFNEALTLPESERAVFLDGACGTDAELRREVDSLIAGVDEPVDFFSESVFTLGALVLANQESESLIGHTLGAYTIIRPIGRGGMGEVYLARDERLDRKVAIKVLPISLVEDQERIRRFKHEARAASAISHPNVAHVYEIGEANGMLFTAMEFVDGITLRARLSFKTLKLGEALDIATQVALAIAAAHAEGIVHRDVKPENIMIRRDGLVKVVDFGLAKLTEPQQTSANAGFHETQLGARMTQTIYTEAGVLMGTTYYMSPEQARGQEVDARTDIWSWGVVFYEMIAGEPPFTGATNSDVIAEILKSEPPLVRTELPCMPQSATLILRKSLKKDRDERYRTMTALILEVRELRRQVEERRLLDCDLRLELVESSHLDSPRKQSRHDVAASPPALAVDTGGFISVSTKPVMLPTKRQRLPRTSVHYLVAGGILIVALSFVLYIFVGRRTVQRGLGSGPPQIVFLTNDGKVMDGALSADARFLAYASTDGGKQSLWIQNLQSGEKTQIMPPDPALRWGLRFTPNGQSLFYIMTQPGSTINVLYRMPIHGGPSQKVIVNIDGAPAVSPDGMQISFIRGYPAQHRDVIIIANVDGSAEREIGSRQHPDRISFSGASWSPDSKLIAIGAKRANRNEVAILGFPVNGGAPIELTPWQWSEVRGVAWKNDGHTLVFSARMPGSRALQVWRLSYPEGTPQQITVDDNSYEEVSLAQNENSLITSRTYEISNLWVSDLVKGARQISSDLQAGADGLTTTSDGRIVFTVGDYEDSTLWSMNADGSNLTRLTRNNGFLPAASNARPLIAYVSTEGGARHIWLMDTDGKNNRRLTNGGGENHPSLTSDGNWVVYDSLADQRGTLWKVSTRGGQPIQLTHDSITVRPVVSPDGTKIACTFRADETDNWKVAVLSFDGHMLLKTFAFPYAYNQIIHWTTDNKALLYVDKRGGVNNIWRQPLDESPRSQVTNFSEDLILHFSLLSKDGEIVLSRGGRRRDIALIKYFD